MKTPWLLVAMISACVHTSTPTSSSGSYLEEVDASRARVEASSTSTELVVYANDVRNALENAAYEAAPERRDRDVADCLRRLEAAMAQSGPGDRAELRFWHGWLNELQGQRHDAIADFVASVELDVNAHGGDAALHLVAIDVGNGERAAALELCASYVPRIEQDSTRYFHIEKCREATGAMSERDQMAWADEPTQAFYRAYHQARADEREQERQDEAVESERQDELVEQAEECALSCKESGYECISQCGDDDRCVNACTSANQACVDGCASVAIHGL